MNKTTAISIRVTRAFKDRLIRHCKQLGIEISEYITHLILQDLADATKGAQPEGDIMRTIKERLQGINCKKSLFTAKVSEILKVNPWDVRIDHDNETFTAPGIRGCYTVLRNDFTEHPEREDAYKVTRADEV